MHPVLTPREPAFRPRIQNTRAGVAAEDVEGAAEAEVTEEGVAEVGAVAETGAAAEAGATAEAGDAAEAGTLAATLGLTRCEGVAEYKVCLRPVVPMGTLWIQRKVNMV